MAVENPNPYADTPPPDGWYWYEAENGDREVIQVEGGCVYQAGSDVVTRLSGWPGRGELHVLEGRILGPVAEDPNRLTTEDLRQGLGENVPGFVQTLAAAMDCTIPQLLADVARGRVSKTGALEALARHAMRSTLAVVDFRSDQMPEIIAVYGTDSEEAKAALVINDEASQAFRRHMLGKG